MPTFRGEDDAPVVQFDPGLEISPFTLFRRLQAGTAPRLVDVRAGAPRASDSNRSLAGAERPSEGDWKPESLEEEVVLLDDHGNAAAQQARRLQSEGYRGVKALFGGLDLYEFSLDPEIVGAETFLRKA